MPAVSLRSRVSPRLTGVKSFCKASSISCFVKSPSGPIRMVEWFLEKATEIGVSEIIPLICERTEKQNFRFDRMKGICISAMLQSQQCWLPVLHEPGKYIEFIKYINERPDVKKFIAYCDDQAVKQNLSTFQPLNHSTILIGPEGDFTKPEIELALQNDFTPVSLGETRLRSETAGIVAATLLCLT